MRALRWLWRALTGLGTLLMFGSQVGPDDAVSNLSKWPAKFLGWDAPAWLKNPLADEWFFWLGAALVLVGLCFWVATRMRKPKAPVQTLGLGERAEDALRRISALTAKHPPRLMPDHPGYRGPTTNETADALFMREYHDTIAADVRGILAEADRRILLDDSDRIFINGSILRNGVPEIEGALARIVANVKAGSRRPLPPQEFLLPTPPVDEARNARLAKRAEFRLKQEDNRRLELEIERSRLAPKPAQQAVPFASVHLRFDTKTREYEVLKQENITAPVKIDADSHGATMSGSITEMLTHYAYVVFDRHGKFSAQFTSSPGISASLDSEGSDYARIKMVWWPMAAMSFPTSGTVVVHFYSEG